MRNGPSAATVAKPNRPALVPVDIPLIRLPARAGTARGFRNWFLSTPLPTGVQFSFLDGFVWVGSDELDLNLWIPLAAFDPEGFREWAVSPDFPQRGRISFLEGELWIDMSPEEIETHLKVKTALGMTIPRLNRQLQLGEYYGDGMTLTLPSGFTTVPDNLLVTFEAMISGRVRKVCMKDELGKYTSIIGSPDWIAEIVSQSSVDKDTRVLRRQYLRAQVSEYWIIDARGEDILFRMLVRRGQRFIQVPMRQDWYHSPFFDRGFRLERWRNKVGGLEYDLHVRDS